jgi:hypothetical protein
MQWETIFGLANIWPLPFWLLLAFGPRTEITAKIVLFGGIAPLALVYWVLLPLILYGQIDPGSTGEMSTDLTSLSGIMGFFASKGGATVGWIHYLALDLFTGLWVGRNADRYGYHRIVQIVLLFFVLMAGPMGLAMYLAIRLTCKNPPQNAVAPS